MFYRVLIGCHSSSTGLREQVTKLLLNLALMNTMSFYKPSLLLVYFFFITQILGVCEAMKCKASEFWRDQQFSECPCL